MEITVVDFLRFHSRRLFLPCRDCGQIPTIGGVTTPYERLFARCCKQSIEVSGFVNSLTIADSLIREWNAQNGVFVRSGGVSYVV